MKKLTTAALLLGSMMSASASAALMFDQDVTPDVIFGGGNANGSFTTDRANGIELGLRGKVRHDLGGGGAQNAFNSNGDGTYTFDAGQVPGQGAGTGVWSFEWSINTDYLDTSGQMLDDLTYMLSLDSDPSAAVSYISFDPINDINPGSGVVAWDHSVGTNATANGGGTESSSADAAGYGASLAVNNVAQNSWKAVWFFPGYDPTVDGTYDISLSAKNGQGLELARTTIQIIQGAGATIPEPGTMAILLTGLLGLAARKKFVK